MPIRTLLRRLRRDERGSLSAELVILAPALLVFVLIAVAFGRYALGTINVQSAANAAARDASLSRTVAAASTNATTAAASSLRLAGVNCLTTQTVVDAGGVAAPLGTIGTVDVTLTCVVNLSDISVPGLPGTWTITATGSSPVDPYRERP